MRRSRAVRARMRRTWAPVTASLTCRPSAWARLCAPCRACSPAQSQNRVRVMSTTRAGPGRAAAWSRAARSAAALVMSISRGAITTGTPRVTWTGNLGSVIVIVVTTCERGRDGLRQPGGPVQGGGQRLERFDQGAGEPQGAVQAGQLEQPPGLRPGADHVQAGPAGGGAAGRAGQRAEPGRAEEGDPVQVGDQRPAVTGQGEQLLAQPGHGEDIDLPGHRDDRIAGLAPDADGQAVVVHGPLTAFRPPGAGACRYGGPETVPSLITLSRMCCAGPSRPRAGRRALRLDLPGAQVEV